MTKALVMAPAWVGDMVMAHSLIRLLAPMYTHICVAAPNATRALALRMAEVDDTVEANFIHGRFALGARRRLGASLRAAGFDAAYVLQNGWKHALVPYFANIPLRIGWLGEARYGLLTRQRRLDKHKYPLMVERFMALANAHFELPAKPYPRPLLQVDAANQADFFARHGVAVQTPFVALCPGAEGGASKRWPPTSYAQLAQRILSRGFACWLLGGPRDRPACDAIEAAVPDVTNLAGETSLTDVVDVLAAAHSVVSNDSGLMHVSCAVGVPTVGIYGSTSPDFTPPLGDDAQIVERSLHCRPCHQPVCRYGHYECLTKLSVDRVFARLPL